MLASLLAMMSRALSGATVALMLAVMSTVCDGRPAGDKEQLLL